MYEYQCSTIMIWICETIAINCPSSIHSKINYKLLASISNMTWPNITTKHVSLYFICALLNIVLINNSNIRTQFQPSEQVPQWLDVNKQFWIGQNSWQKPESDLFWLIGVT